MIFQEGDREVVQSSWELVAIMGALSGCGSAVPKRGIQGSCGEREAMCVQSLQGVQERPDGSVLVGLRGCICVFWLYI